MIDPQTDPRSATNNPQPQVPFAEAMNQLNKQDFAGINPASFQYLIRALSQYGQMAGVNPNALRPQYDPLINV